MDAISSHPAATDRLLSQDELCERLNVERRLIERQRARGEGPPYVRISPRIIRYRPEDVSQWLASRVSSVEHAT